VPASNAPGEFLLKISFFFNSHLDFFEEIAKYRAARRIWARTMKEKYKAKDPQSWKLRFHAQTAGCSLTAQQPENNISRTAFQGLAAVLGGAQSLHTNSMDETLALPSEKAAEIALRTQQLIAFETGVANVADPLGGSYFVENLTDQLEDDAENYFKEIDKLGGVIPAIEKGYFQYEISRSASSHQKKIDNRELIHVGVNDYIKSDEEIEIPILEIGKEAEDFQKKSIKSLKNNRNSQAVDSSLAKIKDAAKSDKNLLPPIIEAANSFATIGEIVISLKEEFGEWNETSVF